MEVKELRIGNYIKDGFGDTKQVTMTFHTEIGVEPFKSFNDPIIMFNEDIAKPIPLTEEWLLKFGFELLDEDLFILRFADDEHQFSDLWTRTERGLKIQLDTFDKKNEDSTNIELSNIKHVHQLQNLYFS